MINITNNELKTSINQENLKKDAKKIMNLMDYDSYDLGILLTDNQTIQRFNREYRNKDEPTDILSFPYHPLKPGEKIQVTDPEDKNIGDLIISLEYVKDFCQKENKIFHEYLRTLLCHGICHLLGYDHDTDETDAVMREKESWLAEMLAKED